MECGGVRPAARPQGGKQLLEVKPDAKLATQLQWPSTVKVSPLARGASGGSRRLDAWHGREDRGRWVPSHCPGSRASRLLKSPI